MIITIEFTGWPQFGQSELIEPLYTERAAMKTPREKYMNDPEYHQLVRMLEEFIERARFTPSELREAAVLASINYEMRHIREHAIDPRMEHAFRVLDEFTTRRHKR